MPKKTDEQFVAEIVTRIRNRATKRTYRTTAVNFAFSITSATVGAVDDDAERQRLIALFTEKFAGSVDTWRRNRKP